MKLKRNKDNDSRPINLILLAVSFIIFGALGIVFITQMELHSGWAWEEIRDRYPIEMTAFETDDINGNGINEIISYADIHGTDRPERYESIQYGAVFCLEGANGIPLWAKEYDGPVQNVFPIMDIDGYGVKDYFVCKASISPNWTVSNNQYNIDIQPNFYTNQLINGSDGTDIPILMGDGLNFTNYYVHDLLFLDDLDDSQVDLILLEGEGTKFFDGNNTWIEYNCSINSYFINGTKVNTINEVWNGHIRSGENLPAFELFQFTDQSQLLFLSRDSMFLYNLSSENMLGEIYNVTFHASINDYEIIEDLNLDGVPEILVETWNGNITILNGLDGGELYNIPMGIEGWEAQLTEIHSVQGDGICYFLFKMRYNDGVHDNYKIVQIYNLELTSHELLWEKTGPERYFDVVVLEQDFDNDSVDELIYYTSYRPFVGFSSVNRYKIVNFFNWREFAIINTEYGGNVISTIGDFDGDGKNDFCLSGDDRIVVLATRKPLGIWLSPLFPLGFPLFIILAILLIVGVLIIILRGKRLQYRRQAVGEHKLTVVVNVLAIGLMTLTFLLFLMLMNVFNNTLVTGSNNSNIVIAFLLVTIVWYGGLPLTAALYNRFAPQFAFIFIKLRDLFFKVSKGYKHDIFVLDMGERKEIGLIIQLKRLILPLLLSIAVGFYVYGALTTLFNYPTSFDIFGSTEFFNFMMGYMLFCILPMILSFLLFAFFISGNYLLDDAGIVYFRENKKYRQPGDLEPISVWAQSIIKGIAGLSALITFASFLGTVDFAGFFGEGSDFFGLLFGFLITVVMFFGIPFLTAFSYVLLAGEVMELNAENNSKKLYNIMETNGYDTKPHDITKIYPSGFKPSKRDTSENMNEDFT
ncbi:MAG: hypothetical protein ACFFDF_15735 [Candidatus Odinarchaeota archaeon]